jgi:hypothetical protein
VFEQMFAIGHEDLIRGGEEIISGKGNVGEALFAAGAGLIRLQNVQKDLDQRMRRAVQAQRIDTIDQPGDQGDQDRTPGAKGCPFAAKDMEGTPSRAE